MKASGFALAKNHDYKRFFHYAEPLPQFAAAVFSFEGMVLLFLS